MGTMCVWLKEARCLASSRNRRFASGSPASAGISAFTATSRPSWRWVPANTTPAPPRPISSPTTYDGRASSSRGRSTAGTLCRIWRSGAGRERGEPPPRRGLLLRGVRTGVLLDLSVENGAHALADAGLAALLLGRVGVVALAVAQAGVAGLPAALAVLERRGVRGDVLVDRRVPVVAELAVDRHLAVLHALALLALD